eukprot:GFUD01038487.1.p1 GENE.GFUD01038487.1~~GFUD01038487.1.p1  ORF type:complete len:1060 (+),score=292.99 GFUD01038487.1:172-3180(+)
MVMSKETDQHPLPFLEAKERQCPPDSSSCIQEEDDQQTPNHFLPTSVPCHSTPLSDLSECLEMIGPLAVEIEENEGPTMSDVDLGLSENLPNFEAATHFGLDLQVGLPEVPSSNTKVKAIKLVGVASKSSIKPLLKPKVAPKPNLRNQQESAVRPGSGVSKAKLPMVVRGSSTSGPKEDSVKTLLSQDARSATKEIILARKSSVTSNTPSTEPTQKLGFQRPQSKLLSVKSVPQPSLAQSSSKAAKSSLVNQKVPTNLARSSNAKVITSESSLTSCSSTKPNTYGRSTFSNPNNILKSGTLLCNRRKSDTGKSETSNLKKSSSTLASSERLSTDRNGSNKSSSKILQKSVSNLSANFPSTSSVPKSTTTSLISCSKSKNHEKITDKVYNNNVPKSNMKPKISLGNASKPSVSSLASSTGARPKHPVTNIKSKTTNAGTRSTLLCKQRKSPVKSKSPSVLLKSKPTISSSASNIPRLTISNSFVATDVDSKPSLPPRSLSSISVGKNRSSAGSHDSSARKLSDVKSFPPTGRLSLTGRSAPRATPNRSKDRLSSSHLLTPTSSQPDLVKTSTPHTDLRKEVASLQSCLAAKIEEVDRTKMIAKDNIAGFDVLGIVIKNILQQETEQVQHLEYNIEACQSRNHSLQLEMENSKQKHKVAEEDFNKLLLQLGRDIENMCRKHEEEKSSMKEANRCQLETQKFDQQEKMRKREIRNERDLALLKENHLEDIHNLERSNLMILAKEKACSDEKEVELKKSFNEEKDQLVQKIQQLETKISSLVISLMNGPDHRDGVMAEMQKEIESLRAVVEMRNGEIKTVNLEKRELCQKLSPFEEMKDKVKNLSSQVEDLKELMAVKRSNERKLDVELQNLQTSMQKQSREKRRLSMEKEQLEWRMRQGMPLQRCLMQENQSHSFSGETQHSRRNFKTFHIRSPSCDYTEPLPLQSCSLGFSPPSSSSTPSVVDYRTSRASVSYQLDLSDSRSPDCSRIVQRRPRRLDTGLGDRQ